jgi:DNA-binding IclR family transcriptional regulator
VPHYPRLRCAITLHKVLLFIAESRQGGRTVKEIAAHINLSPKSVRRYLQAIEQAGYPIFDEVAEGYMGEDQTRLWKLDKRWIRTNVI